MDTNVFNAVFWSLVVSTLAGLILKLSSMAYKSKCKEVSCCCLKIVRDTEIEEKEQEFAIDLHNKYKYLIISIKKIEIIKLPK
jgi:hypothetical protein